MNEPKIVAEGLDEMSPEEMNELAERIREEIPSGQVYVKLL